jgi:hypothetical protein
MYVIPNPEGMTWLSMPVTFGILLIKQIIPKQGANKL